MRVVHPILTTSWVNWLIFFDSRGIFDQSCIIITSPHGEIMQFHDCCFHHHVPHVDVYDIPLIIKLPHQTQKQSVSGIIQNVDMLPTVAGLLGLSLPGAVTGGMNLAQYCRQGLLPVRKYAEAFDIHDLTRSIIDSNYLYVKFREDYRITSQWSGKKDAEFLFKRDDSSQGMVPADHPEQLQRMRKMLGENQGD